MAILVKGYSLMAGYILAYNKFFFLKLYIFLYWEDNQKHVHYMCYS